MKPALSLSAMRNLVRTSPGTCQRKHHLDSGLLQEFPQIITIIAVDSADTKHGIVPSRNTERVYRALNNPDFPVLWQKSKARDTQKNALLHQKHPLLDARMLFPSTPRFIGESFQARPALITRDSVCLLFH
jgi:hypothetical protein